MTPTCRYSVKAIAELPASAWASSSKPALE